MGVPYAEVIGDPISHSKSPPIHKFWLEKLGLEGDYRTVRVTPPTLGEYLSERRRDSSWRGCNVTMPLKMKVLHHLSDWNEEAGTLGAVNCVAPRRDALWGTNFDVAAVLELMAPLHCQGWAVLIGSGGAARAALWALRLAGFKRIKVIARDADKASEMIDTLGVEAEVAPMTSALEGDVLINATPLGMAGYPPLDISLNGMAAGCCVLDMVYNPVETTLLAQAKRRGFRTIDGLEMLIEQAAMSFATFFGRSPPRQHDAELRELLTS